MVEIASAAEATLQMHIVSASCESPWKMGLSTQRYRRERHTSVRRTVGYHIPCKSAGESANSKKTERNAKQSLWRTFCQGTEDVPGSARLMKIMAKIVTNKVTIIHLPDENSTASGVGTQYAYLRYSFLTPK